MSHSAPDLALPVAVAVVLDGGRVLMIRRRVPEGDLVWQVPAGKVEPGDSPKRAAVSETLEETGFTVTAVKVLGDRVHPKTGRQMHYIECELVKGRAIVGDTEEIAEVEWIEHGGIPERAPYGLFEPVQQYLDDTLERA
ncbi:NUDIX hydrolase [Streptomyces specialis]|uniref:NUDIX hydrolase n=1 Tax=Streptomyces specialis TaxID=498367 RepID=UPI00073F59F8|nr:NUDIX hydrolase [Streptomyces specialis]